ncbi:MAG: tRNA (N(6)-L-threonylcarbamoyladenosine(37)-C(2))-methylthiotransferase MtaB [Deltaproteobacteria bacterium]|nr:MAG: tRNA (N(6)-L-threonylcarbamoyladenosine(37)-C(2))-methylthiotransferase MtaB [Deltaproteobacteria bacterium]
MKNFKIINLGCKSNRFESDSISMQLKQKGYEPSQSNSDIVVINTCTVTSKAGMQSRQEIRKALKENPEAKIIVTGCHAQTQPGEISAIDKDIIIVDQEHKNLIPSLIDSDSKHLFEKNIITGSICRDNKFRFMPSGNFLGRTRAFLKIQDGCNAFCSYCIIPYARGKSRSMEFKKVIEQLQLLKEKSYKEVVLTGIHIGLYGEDLNKKTSFTSLIKYIYKYKNNFPRLRISSIEPNEISDEIIEIASENNVLCPHFHIPFQNGDDYILGRMKRPYNRTYLYSLTKKIYDKVKNVSIGADILIGFPGESEECFKNTYSLLNDLPLTYLHVFPYSPRKNTPAAGFKDQVNGKIAKKRTFETRKLSNLKKELFYKSQIGKTKKILFEKKRDKATGLLKGFSENYILCHYDGNNELKNTIETKKIEYDETRKIMVAKD